MKSLTPVFASIVFLTLTACKDKNIQEEFYSNGMLKQSAEMKDGMRNGLTKYYDEEGRLVSTAELKNNVYEGWMINYYPETHKVTAKAYFKNGKQNGPVIQYYIDGSLYRESYYKDGKVDSIMKTYWPDGKIQAESYFKMGMPSIGMKEYDREGNPVKLPHIVVEEINEIPLLNTVTLKIYLSDHYKKAKFYQGKLEEGVYLSPYTEKLASQDGVVSLQFYVPRHTSLMKKISIISKSRTGNGNTLILQRYYNLAVSN